MRSAIKGLRNGVALEPDMVAEEQPHSQSKRPLEVEEGSDGNDTDGNSDDNDDAFELSSKRIRKKTVAGKVKVSLERYKSISKAILHHLREHVDQSGSQGMTRSELVDWHLSLQANISTDKGRAEEAQLVRSIIKHMQKTDGLLMLVCDGNDEDAIVALC